MASCPADMPLTHQQLRLLMAEIAELQRIGYGEIRLVVHDGRVNIVAITRTVKISNADQVQTRLDELENGA